MKLYFYRGEEPNFGDELNNWLMPKIFPNFFDQNGDVLFLGIGSIIFNTHPPGALKIVFGSGYGGYTPLPKLDHNWNFYCVRGPETARACGLSADKVAGDTAILMNRYKTLNPEKKYRRSFMPHWESIHRGNWQAACKLTGIHFLDPRHSVDQVLSEMEASEVVLTEAMHGAIVADALRVPWIAVRPFHESHVFKWTDWAGALGLSLALNRVLPSSVLEARIAGTRRHGGRLRDPKGLLKLGVRMADQAFICMAAASLWRTSRLEPVLSSDTALMRAVEHLESDAMRIKQDFRQ